jgi:hypothetical protein
MSHAANPTVSQLKGNRRYVWPAMLLIGAAVLVAVVLFTSNREPTPGPAVNVPSMQNVPPPNTKLGVEVEEQR